MSRVYYNRASNPPNINSEYYTDEYWIQFNSVTSCNSPSNASATYVLTGDISARSGAINGRCYVNYANAYTQGTPVTFPRTYRCPLDDYIPYLLFLMIPLSIVFARKQLLQGHS